MAMRSSFIFLAVFVAALTIAFGLFVKHRNVVFTGSPPSAHQEGRTLQEAAPTPLSNPETATKRSPISGGHGKDRIEGRVLHAGAPIYDATIIYRACSSPSKPSELAVTTNRQGDFLVSDVHAPCYQLDVSKVGFASTTIMAEPGMRLLIELEEVLLTGVLERTLVDPDGVPLNSFELSVLRRRRNGWASLISHELISTPDGGFRESISLPDDQNELAVIFSANGFRNRTISCAGLAKGSRVDLGIVRAERFAGRLQGQVVNAIDNTPVPGAAIRPISTGGRTEDELAADSDGRFAVTRLSANDLIGIAVSSQEFAPLYWEVPAQGQGHQGPIIIRLSQGAEIHGTVVSVKGEIPSTVHVGYWSKDGNSIMPGLPHLISSIVRVDPSGEYRMPHVPTKQMIIGIVKLASSGGLPITEFQHLTTVQCMEGEKRKLDFILGEGARISAILHSQDRSPMALLAATLVGENASPVAEVQCSLGASIIFEDVHPGQYVLRVSSTSTSFMNLNIVVSGDDLTLGEVDVGRCFSPEAY